MASINNNSNKGGSSAWLTALREQLRRYKAPTDDDDEEKEVSGMGIVESAATAPIAERFRPKKAAVLICLFQSQNENHNNNNNNNDNNNNNSLRVILTKRSSNLSTHSGEVSLPGGKAEEDDVDDAHTATREAKEEIGLDPSLVDVVALLEPFLSKHLLQVIPVIGILSDRNAFNPTPNVDEVDDVFDAPLEMFLKTKLPG
uniref:nudix hydrolase 15, mitochondrial-like isoform X2 n=1 Tax=Erigeron canadensis TaxID=72917 RepID=UPI001CB8DC08|nr:nudix hydrolase 15, mitochondrial-like isoform X2 [Erigeron canadensis]